MLGKLGKKSSYMFLLTGTTFYHSYKEIREKQLVCQGQGIQQRPFIPWGKESVQSSLLCHVPPAPGRGRNLFPHSQPWFGSWFCGQREQTLLGDDGIFISAGPKPWLNLHSLGRDTDASQGNSCLKVGWIAEMEWNTWNSDRLLT